MAFNSHPARSRPPIDPSPISSHRSSRLTHRSSRLPQTHSKHANPSSFSDIWTSRQLGRSDPRAIVRPLKSRSPSSSLAGRRSSRSGSFVALWPNTCNTEIHDLHIGPVTDWERHSSLKRGECRQRDGCAGDNKSAHPYKERRFGQQISRAIDTQCRPKAGCADQSNPHIRIFQTPQNLVIPNPTNLVILSAAKNPPISLLPLPLFLPLLVLLNQPQTLGCPIHRELAMGGMYELKPAGLWGCP